MNAEQLGALIELIQVSAVEAAHDVTMDGCGDHQEERTCMRRLYEVFGLELPSNLLTAEEIMRRRSL